MGGGKQTLNGKEYDFVFEIEIEEVSFVCVWGEQTEEDVERVAFWRWQRLGWGNGCRVV